MIKVLESASGFFGHDVTAPDGLLVVLESREIMLTNRALNDLQVGTIYDQVNVDTRHGIF